MEISSVEMDDSDLYLCQEPVPYEWDKVSQTALLIFAFITALAAVSVITKKKRIISALTQPNTPPPPESPVEEPSLPAPRCTLAEKRKVEDIFRTVAEGGANLYLFGIRLISVGNDIEHIHPFSFLLAAPREHLRTIFHSGSDFKIGNVMKGVKRGMNREYAKNNLTRYIPDFAAAFGKDPAVVRPLIHGCCWRRLVHYLFEVKAPHDE